MQDSHGLSRGCLRKLLAAEVQALDDLLVFLLGAFLDVIQQLAALGDHFQKSTAGRKVLLVVDQVLGEMRDALGQQGHLVGRAASVAIVQLVVLQVDFVGAHIGSGGPQQRSAKAS